jgi:hypothetical protein
MQLVWRGAFAGLGAVAVISSGVIPPLHAHEANTHRQHTIVHRHETSHHHSHPTQELNHARFADPRDISNHDDDAVWINVQSTGCTKISLDAGTALPCETLLFTAVVEGLSLAIAKNDSLPHGPPGTTSTLRAPPTSSV